MSQQSSEGQEQNRRRTLPSFVKKLWIIVNDPDNNHLIWWAVNGKSIWIPDAAAFSRSVLPRHFKHSNWQSFVRQLNLYGFRKVCDAELLDQTRINTQDGWQFRHENFQVNGAHLLHRIKRKRNQNKSTISASLSSSSSLSAAITAKTTTPYPIQQSGPASWSPTSSSSHPPIQPVRQREMVGEQVIKLFETLSDLEERSGRIQHVIRELHKAQCEQREVMQSLLPLIKMLLNHPQCSGSNSSNGSNSNKTRVQLHHKIDKLHHQLTELTDKLNALPGVLASITGVAAAVASTLPLPIPLPATTFSSYVSASKASTTAGGNNSGAMSPYPNTLPPIRTDSFELLSSFISPKRVILPSIANTYPSS